MKERIELDEAYQIFDTYVKPIETVETIPLEKALNRILAQDIYATLDQPPFNKSAVDGYAFHYEESEKASQENPSNFEVVDIVYAGDVCHKEIKKGQAIQVMTGGCVPDDCDCVIRQEDTNDSTEHLEVYKSCKFMDNICIQGEDFKKGDLLLKKGSKLDYICLGILASIGLHEVEVYSKVKIALCTTGSELTRPGAPLEEGKIYDSNYMLLSMRLKQLGYEIEAYSFIEDDEEKCAQIFEEYSKKYDLIISTGAVSVGKKDIIHPALELAKADKIFWRVKLKPGTPAIFSVLNGTPIISLSGNPFAASCTFEILARYILSILSQDVSLKCVPFTAILMDDFKKKSPQRRFVRAIEEDGKVSIPSGMHSSNELGSMIGCNAMIDIPAKNQGLEKGSKVQIWKL